MPFEHGGAPLNELTEQIARHAWGEPNRKLSSAKELRWGSRGSKVLNIRGPKKGLWYDFEVAEGGGALDLVMRQFAPTKAGAFKWLREAGLLRGDEGGRARRPMRRREPRAAAEPPTTPKPPSDFGRKLWMASEVILGDADHPARRWARWRKCWRAEVGWPPAIRWVRAEHISRRHQGAGAIISGFAPLAEWFQSHPNLPSPSGVALIHLDKKGRPCFDRSAEDGGLRKRSQRVTEQGMTDAVLVIGAIDHGRCCAAEGVADSLALAARRREPVVCVNGTSTMRSAALAAALASTDGALIFGDMDGPGQEAADILRGAVQRHGGRAWLMPISNGKDPAEAAETFRKIDQDGFAERSAILEYDYELPRHEAERLASIETEERANVS